MTRGLRHRGLVEAIRRSRTAFCHDSATVRPQPTVTGQSGQPCRARAFAMDRRINRLRFVCPADRVQFANGRILRSGAPPTPLGAGARPSVSRPHRLLQASRGTTVRTLAPPASLTARRTRRHSRCQEGRRRRRRHGRRGEVEVLQPSPNTLGGSGHGFASTASALASETLDALHRVRRLKQEPWHQAPLSAVVAQPSHCGADLLKVSPGRQRGEPAAPVGRCLFGAAG